MIEAVPDVDTLLTQPHSGVRREVYWVVLHATHMVPLGLFTSEARATALALEVKAMVAPIVLDQWRGPTGTNMWPGAYLPYEQIRPAEEIEQVLRWRSTLGIEVGSRELIDES